MLLDLPPMHPSFAVWILGPLIPFSSHVQHFGDPLHPQIPLQPSSPNLEYESRVKIVMHVILPRLIQGVLNEIRVSCFSAVTLGILLSGLQDLDTQVHPSFAIYIYIYISNQ